jgi:hypothetical protein
MIDNDNLWMVQQKHLNLCKWNLYGLYMYFKWNVIILIFMSCSGNIQWNIPEKRYLYLVTLHIFWLWTTWYHTNVQNVFQQNLFCPESFWIVAHWKKKKNNKNIISSF